MKRKSIYFASLSCATSSYLKKTDEEFRAMDPALWEVSPRFVNKNDTFYHKDALFSASLHQKLYPDLRKQLHLDDDVNIFVDSGGYSLVAGTITEKTWNNETALAYSERNGNIFPILDRPVSNAVTPADIQACLDKTMIAAKYYEEHRTKDSCDILNVLSARTSHDMEHWYNSMKEFSFEGWAHGGHSGNLKVALKGILFLLAKGEYDKDRIKFHHVFGISGMAAIVYFALVQQLLNKMGVDIQLTFDSSYFQRQMGFGAVFINPKWTGMGILPYSNKNDYSHMDDVPMVCDCAICKTVPSVKKFLESSMTFYMKGLTHNLLMMDRIKHQAESIFDTEILEQQKTVFGAEIYNNTQLLRKAFANPKAGMEYIDRMSLKDLGNSPVSLENLF